MVSKEVELVNTQVAGMVERMEPRHIALLIAKIMNPDKPLIELSNELWPDLGYDGRRRIVNGSQVSKVIGLVSTRPWIMAKIMSNKLAPVMTAVLYELALGAEKENVRATAAKELIRLAQSTANSLAPSDEEPMPVDEQDGLLEQYTGDEDTIEAQADEVPAAPSADELLTT